MEKLLRKSKFRPLDADDYDLYADYADKAAGAVSPCMGFEMLYMWSGDIPVYCREVGKFLLLILHDRAREQLICCPPLGDYKHYSAARAVESLMLLYENAGQPLRMRYVKDWMLPYLKAVQGFAVREDYDMDECDILYLARDFAYSLRRAEAVRLLAAIAESERPQTVDYDGDGRQELLQFFERQQCAVHACAQCGGVCARKALERALDLSENFGVPVRCAKGDNGVFGLAVYAAGNDTLSVLFYETAGLPGADQYARGMIAEDMTDRVRHVVNAFDCNRESRLAYKRSLSHYIQSRNYRVEIARGSGRRRDESEDE